MSRARAAGETQAAAPRAARSGHRRHGHEYPGVVPGVSFARGAVINCTCKIARGSQSGRNSHGNRSSIARHVNAASSRSAASKSPMISAVRWHLCEPNGTRLGVQYFVLTLGPTTR